MAKLEIFNSNQKVQGSNTPNTSALALPLSLAKQVGSGFSAVTKSIAAIQKDLYAVQDEFDHFGHLIVSLLKKDELKKLTQENNNCQCCLRHQINKPKVKID